MDLGLKGRTALITGASRGIGYAIAEVLAAEGCELHIVARTRSALEAAEERLGAAYSVKVTVHECDAGDPGALPPLVAACGEIDILVNNAGTVPRGGLEAIDDSKLRDGWDLKLFGYYNLTRLVMPQMLTRGQGVVVNIIGLAGDRPSPDYVAGSMGNAALMALSKALGGDSIRHGVRVVGVNPARILTDRQEAKLREESMKRFGDASRFMEIAAEQRMGTPRDVANLVAFLASDLASHISGTIVTADGGLSAR